MTRPTSLLELSRVDLLTRRAKIAALATHRLVEWVLDPHEFRAPSRRPSRAASLRYSARIPLGSAAPSDPRFEAGKRHNVRLAAPAFDGVAFSAEHPFSFWRTLGRVTEAGGYRHGMELAGGCIVPAIGGGLCLLSRALFQAAVFGGLEVLERHGHSLAAVEPPPGVPFGIDATILWPYVDLRFAPSEGEARLSVRVRDEALLVDLFADTPLTASISIASVDDTTTHEAEGRVRRNRVLRRWSDEQGRLLRTDVVAVNRTRLLTEHQQRRSCLTCNETSCHARVVPAQMGATR